MTFSLNKKTQPFELNPYNSIIKFRNNYLNIKSVEMIVVENIKKTFACVIVLWISNSSLEAKNIEHLEFTIVIILPLNINV